MGYGYGAMAVPVDEADMESYRICNSLAVLPIPGVGNLNSNTERAIQHLNLVSTQKKLPIMHGSRKHSLTSTMRKRHIYSKKKKHTARRGV